MSNTPPLSDAKTQWDPTFEPLMRLIVDKKGVKTKDVVEVGTKKVQIIRGKDVKELLLNEATHPRLSKLCGPALKQALSGDLPSTDRDVMILGQNLIRNGFLTRAMDNPIKTDPSKADSPQKKKKWPERVVKVAPQQQQFDVASGSGNFYIVNYKPNSAWNHVMLTVLLVVVLVLCMFPAWPMWAKFAGWYVVLCFSGSMTVLLIVRAIAFLALWSLGCDFWIFPNLNDEYLGVIESFKPLYSFQKRTDDKFMVFLRILLVVMTSIGSYHVSQHHSLGDFVEVLYLAGSDIKEWGELRLAAPMNTEPKYKSIEHIHSETADIDEEMIEEVMASTEEPPMEREEFEEL